MVRIVHTIIILGVSCRGVAVSPLYSTLENLRKNVVLLDDANFDFGTSREERWEENFRHLAGYRRRHGDCDVPRRYGPHPSLGRWVRRQRIELRNNGGRGGLSDDERYGRLAALGFCGSMGGGGGGGGGEG